MHCIISTWFVLPSHAIQVQFKEKKSQYHKYNHSKKELVFAVVHCISFLKIGWKEKTGKQEYKRRPHILQNFRHLKTDKLNPISHYTPVL
jgi:hypothetical protein